MPLPPLASGPEGPRALGPLLDTVLEALRAGARARGGPLPAGGPEAVAARVREAVGRALPEEGDPEAPARLVRALAEGAADPADPLCAAHLHCPPLAVAVAADVAASVLNPSLDSWDQAPAASELEQLVMDALAAEVYRTPVAGAEADTATGAHTITDTDTGAGPAAEAGAAGAAGTDPGTSPDALMTTGGTESNQLAVLLARETLGAGTRLLYGANAHHSLPRAAWLLGMPEPVRVPAPAGTMDPAALDAALREVPGPHLVAATAGTTDAGLLDPLPEIAEVCRGHGARLHVDAAYGGGLLFSDRRRALLAGLEAARSVTLDLHKLGWQPVAAGVLAVRDARDLGALHLRADYLNADDDTEAGLPDLLGRSLRTTRRPDVLKVAATFGALGRTGLGRLVDEVCERARDLARLVREHPGFELCREPVISTVLFRPVGAADEELAAVRRVLLADGRAVLGRARLDGRLWLKATLLNPWTRPADLAALLKTVEGTVPR